MSQITSTIIGSVPGGGPVLTLTGNSGGAVPPTGGGTINVIGAGTINVAGNPGTSTLTITNTAPSSTVFFSAFKSATTANATGDGTTATVVFDTAPSNIGAAYNTGTGVF